MSYNTISLLYRVYSSLLIMVQRQGTGGTRHSARNTYDLSSFSENHRAVRFLPSAGSIQVMGMMKRLGTRLHQGHSC
jgi:hypothetical protein